MICIVYILNIAICALSDNGACKHKKLVWKYITKRQESLGTRLNDLTKFEYIL